MLSPNNLEWESGDRRHFPALQRFVCATPEKKTYDKYRGEHHPQPWQVTVQSWMRNLSLPVHDKEAALMLVDRESDHIGGISHFGFDDTGEQFMIHAIATSVELQKQGVATRVLDMTMKNLVENKQRLGLDCGVFTRIHVKNEPSQKLFTKAGFKNIGHLAYEHEFWLASI